MSLCSEPRHFRVPFSPVNTPSGHQTATYRRRFLTRVPPSTPSSRRALYSPSRRMVGLVIPFFLFGKKLSYCSLSWTTGRRLRTTLGNEQRKVLEFIPFKRSSEAGYQYFFVWVFCDGFFQKTYTFPLVVCGRKL